MKELLTSPLLVRYFDPRPLHISFSFEMRFVSVSCQKMECLSVLRFVQKRNSCPKKEMFVSFRVSFFKLVFWGVALSSGQNWHEKDYTFPNSVSNSFKSSSTVLKDVFSDLLNLPFSLPISNGAATSCQM